MGLLIIVRHGESEWNAKGIWTGFKDVSLSEKGRKESRQVAEKLLKTRIDQTFTSPLKRATETLTEMKQVIDLLHVPNTSDAALNERDYGILTGKNKWEIEKEVGKERFRKLRRGWDVPIPEGETLKDVYNRVIPFYECFILPQLKQDKTVLVVAHGNSLRALVKYLEHISDTDIENLEIATGQVYQYEIDESGSLVNKLIL